jgi:hypothetical protein
MSETMDEELQSLIKELLDTIIDDLATPVAQRELMKTIRDRGAGDFGIMRQIALQVLEIGFQKAFNLPAMMEAFMYDEKIYEARSKLVL